MASEKEKEHSRSHAKASEKGSKNHLNDEVRDQKKSSESRSKEYETRAEHNEREKQNKSRNTEATGKSSLKPSQAEGKLAPGKSARTTDHKVIQQWVEARGGSPAAVIATESAKDPGLLRINFPGYSGRGKLEDISWDEFFKKFDEKKLEFLYQEQKRTGETSRFWKFVQHEDVKGKK